MSSAQEHYALAQQLHRQGRYAEAESHYRKVLERFGDHAGALRRLGEVCFHQKKYEDAARFFRRAAAVAPHDAAALGGLGCTLNKLGRPLEALPPIEAALALAPDNAGLHFDHGHALAALGRLEEALAAYRAIAPRSRDARLLIAHLLVRLARHEEAVTEFEAILAEDPGRTAVWNALGRSLGVLGRAGDAKAAFAKSLAAAPDNPATHVESGIALQFCGCFAEARQAFERAIALQPEMPATWHCLVQGETIRPGDPAIAALEKMAAKAETYPETERVFLHFALAKVYDDLKRYAEAFASLKQGNALQRRLTPYDEAAETALLRNIAVLFSADFLAAHAGAGDASEVPVFIVGMPRSGTTLIEQLLASHPEVVGAGEVSDLAEIFDALGAGKRGPSAAELKQTGARYVQRLRAKAPQARRITNKMPGNFASVGLIAAALPKARIIHLRRDPLDTCFSCYTKLFERAHLYSYDLAELGRYYRAYEGLMAHWRAVLPPGAMLEVAYEELIADFEPVARRIVGYCGLAWDDACLSFHKTARPVDTASSFQVRQPLYRSAVGRAGNYRQWLGPLREALGQR